MSKVVDYIIYMTYDLHGQWDYGNKWATDGCVAGNCLRHHSNKTESELALVMVTKAGVPANKVIFGMPLYGRSFKMTAAGCTGPQCTFVGKESAAAPGRCTGTRGYISNFEIRELIATKSTVKQLKTAEGDDILVYDDTEWVGWMPKQKYDERSNWVKGLNFGGTTDWAIDLDADYDIGDGPGGNGGDGPGGGDNGSGPILVSPDVYTQKPPTLSCYPPCSLILPPLVLSTTTTIKIPPATLTLEEHWPTTITVSGAPITTTGASYMTTVITPPPVTTTAIEVWNQEWKGSTESGKTYGIIWLTSSVPVPPMTITKTATTSGSVTRPAITWTYSPGVHPTDDPDPPFPPPPPFPPSITVSPGPPKPPCNPATQKCGKQCRVNCSTPGEHGGGGGGGGGGGCIWPFCGCIGICPGGGGCLGFCGGGGGGGGGDPNDPSSSCRRSTTASFCEKRCSVYNFPNTQSTTCRDPSCSRTITACSTSGTTTTTTVTLSCPTFPSFDLGNSGDSPLMQIQPGDFDLPLMIGGPGWEDSPTTSSTPSPTKQPTTPDPWPTKLPGDNTHPYCFRDEFGTGKYKQWKPSEGKAVINAICYVSDSLNPATYGHTSVNSNGLMASIQWSKSQAGCPPKDFLPLGDQCALNMNDIMLWCDDGAIDDLYMGGAITLTTAYGCVTLYLGAENKSSAKMTLLSVGEDTAPRLLEEGDEQLQEFQDLMAELEPKLPRRKYENLGISSGTSWGVPRATGALTL